jgi:hypothetical protein
MWVDLGIAVSADGYALYDLEAVERRTSQRCRRKDG